MDIARRKMMFQALLPTVFRQTATISGQTRTMGNDFMQKKEDVLNMKIWAAYFILFAATILSCGCAASVELARTEVLVDGKTYSVYVDPTTKPATASWIIERLTDGEFQLVDHYGNEYDSQSDEKRQEIFKRIQDTDWDSPQEIYNCMVDNPHYRCRFSRKRSEEEGYFVSFAHKGGRFHWGIVWVIDGELMVSYWGEGIISD